MSSFKRKVIQIKNRGAEFKDNQKRYDGFWSQKKIYLEARIVKWPICVMGRSYFAT